MGWVCVIQLFDLEVGGGGGGSLLINVKMPTIGDILTFMSRKNFMLS